GQTCSPAAAAMLLRHYGIDASEGEMAYLARTSLLGTEVQALARALTHKIKDKGWSAAVRTMDYESCITLKKPFIPHVWVPGLGGHAILVESLGQDSVIAVDPRFGQRSEISRPEFEAQWEGIVIAIEGE